MSEEFVPDTLLTGSDEEFVPVEGQTYVKKKAGSAQGRNLSAVLRDRMRTDGKRFWAGDNISEYLDETLKTQLIDEATQAFERVLDSLLIDRENDPNSRGTAKRLAKMYFNEIMEGRYEPAPDATAFPNDSAERYEGMLVVRSELRSMCSHHHQPVSGVAYIGIIAANKLIGLSKYTRIAQWCARRGTCLLYTSPSPRD